MHIARPLPDDRARVRNAIILRRYRRCNGENPETNERNPYEYKVKVVRLYKMLATTRNSIDRYYNLSIKRLPRVLITSNTFNVKHSISKLIH
jgi:hypothetical protein